MVDNPSAAQYLVQHLIDEEIRYVFGITGDNDCPRRPDRPLADPLPRPGIQGFRRASFSWATTRVI